MMNPSSVLIIVLLPAPFGPSRPTAPAGKGRGHVFKRQLRAVADGHALERDDRRLISHAG